MLPLPATAVEFGGHAAHAAAAVAVLYVFVGQNVQALAAVAPVAARYLPAPQSVQAALPGAVLYVPVAHDSHRDTKSEITCVLEDGTNIGALKSPSPRIVTPVVRR